MLFSAIGSFGIPADPEDVAVELAKLGRCSEGEACVAIWSVRRFEPLAASLKINADSWLTPLVDVLPDSWVCKLRSRVIELRHARHCRRAAFCVPWRFTHMQHRRGRRQRLRDIVHALSQPESRKQCRCLNITARPQDVQDTFQLLQSARHALPLQ